MSFNMKDLRNHQRQNGAFARLKVKLYVLHSIDLDVAFRSNYYTIAYSYL